MMSCFSFRVVIFLVLTALTRKSLSRVGCILSSFWHGLQMPWNIFLKGPSCLSIVDIQLCLWELLLARVLCREEGACLAAQPRECVHLQLGHSEGDTASVLLQGQKRDLATLQAVPEGVQVPEHWGVKGRWCCHSVLSVTCDQGAGLNPFHFCTATKSTLGTSLVWWSPWHWRARTVSEPGDTSPQHRLFHITRLAQQSVHRQRVKTNAMWQEVMFSLKDACLAWLRPDYLYICTIYFPLKIQLQCPLGFGHENLIVSCDFSPVLRRGMWFGGVSHFLRGVRRDFKTWWCHSCILLRGVDKSFRHTESLEGSGGGGGEA